jgi:hypothetical protein
MTARKPSFAERLGERGPLPDVVDTDPEDGWELWQEALTQVQLKGVQPLDAQRDAADGQPQYGDAPQGAA